MEDWRRAEIFIVALELGQGSMVANASMSSNAVYHLMHLI